MWFLSKYHSHFNFLRGQTPKNAVMAKYFGDLFLESISELPLKNYLQA
jgi:hypothetical protein